MRHLIALLLLALLGVGAVARDARPLADDEAVEQRLIAIADELRCLVCQNESLAASQSGLAIDLRQQVARQLQAGRSDDEVRRYMVERYGDYVLYRPPFNAATALLWLGPFLLLLAAGLWLWRTIARQAPADADATGPAPAAPTSNASSTAGTGRSPPALRP